MLNPQELHPEFVEALTHSWDVRAIWPGCKKDYKPGISPRCYGQCLAATLNAWVAHGGPEKGYNLVPGLAYGPGLPEDGLWHFQLEKTRADKTKVPVDVTWHQFKEDTVFSPAKTSHDPALFAKIMSGSLMQDASLLSRTRVIAENLARNDVIVGKAPRDIIVSAQNYFLQQVIQSRPPSSVSIYVPREEDYNRIGDNLSDYTDSRRASTWNPMPFAFRKAGKVALASGSPVLAEGVATINQGEAHLDMLFVEGDQRGQGHGTKIVREFEAMAKMMGAVSATLRSPTWQAGGTGFYEGLGYKKKMQIPLHPNAYNQPQFSYWYYKDLRR